MKSLDRLLVIPVAQNWYRNLWHEKGSYLLIREKLGWSIIWAQVLQRVKCMNNSDSSQNTHVTPKSKSEMNSKGINKWMMEYAELSPFAKFTIHNSTFKFWMELRIQTKEFGIRDVNGPVRAEIFRPARRWNKPGRNWAKSFYYKCMSSRNLNILNKFFKSFWLFFPEESKFFLFRRKIDRGLSSSLFTVS